MSQDGRMPPTDDLIGTTETGQILGKTPRTVQRMVSAGALVPVVTLPGKTGAHLFKRADVEALADDREKTSA